MNLGTLIKSWRLRLYGLDVEQVRALALEPATRFGWQVEHPETYWVNSPFYDTRTAIVAVFNLRHSNKYYKVTVSVESHEVSRFCRIKLTHHDELGSPCVTDEHYNIHYETLFGIFMARLKAVAPGKRVLIYPLFAS